MLRAFALPALIFLLSTSSHPAPRPSERELTRLRVQASDVFEQRERARLGGVALDPLYDRLVALADTLERAGLDSLAADARRKAGGVVQRTARAALAEGEFRRAVAIARRARFVSCELESRTLLAQTVSRRDPAAGRTLLRENVAAAARARDPGAHSSALVTWSNALALVGRMREARLAAIDGLREAKRQGNASIRAEALLQVAQCWHFERRLDRALEFADSAVALARTSSALRHPLSRALVSRANTLRALDRPREAAAALEEALAIDRARSDVRHSLNTRHSLGILHASFGDVRHSLAHADTLLRDARRLGDRAMEFRGVAAVAFALAELGRWSEVDTLVGNATPRFEAYRDAQADAESRASSFLRGGEMVATRARALLALGRTREAWQITEHATAAVFREQAWDDPRFVVLTVLQSRLGAEDAALLQWNEPQRNPYVVYVIDGDSVRAVTLDKRRVQADATLARDLLASGAPRSRAEPALARISQVLLRDALARVPAGTKRLWLVPPFEMSGLPMELLPIDGAPGLTLGDRYSIRYVPSAASAVELAARSPAARGLALFADPDARGAATTGAPGLRRLASTRLPGARDECRRIAPFGTPVWSGREATRERLIESGDRAVVHLATHAWVDPTRPEESGLLLAGERGLVTPAQIESLTFRADLVTLSGCRTAQGQAVMGEGVFGLPRAFLLAGARSVVSTAWEVNDRAASRFMVRFYEELRRGVSRDDALRRARATMRAEKWPARDSEAFILSGVGGESVPALADRGWLGR